MPSYFQCFQFSQFDAERRKNLSSKKSSPREAGKNVLIKRSLSITEIDDMKIPESPSVANQLATDFIIRRAVALKTGKRSEKLRNMYKLLLVCLDDHLALHIVSLANSESNVNELTRQELILHRYHIDLLRKPEWILKHGDYSELPDHPSFFEFFQMQLRSDYLFKKNPLRIYRMLSDFLEERSIVLINKRKTNRVSLMYFLKEHLHEFCARDAYVLLRSSNNATLLESNENYLLAKYRFIRQIIEPRKMDSHYLKDKDVTSHPVYREFYLAVYDIQKYYMFGAMYKLPAEVWIYHRLHEINSKERCHPTVRDMYIAVSKKLTPLRAYELFIVSQYRMDIEKVYRLEAYLSEKYRLPTVSPES